MPFMRGLGVGFGWKSSQGFVFGNEDMMKTYGKMLSSKLWTGEIRNRHDLYLGKHEGLKN